MESCRAAPVKQHLSEPTKLQPPACKTEESKSTSRDRAGQLVARSAPCPPSPYAILRGSRPRTETRQRPARSPASLHPLIMHRWHLTAASPQRCAAQNLLLPGTKLESQRPFAQATSQACVLNMLYCKQSVGNQEYCCRKLGPGQAQAACAPTGLGTPILNRCKQGQNGKTTYAPAAVQPGSAHPARAARLGSSR